MTLTIYQKIGQALRTIRKASGTNLDFVPTRTGYTIGFVNNVEDGVKMEGGLQQIEDYASKYGYKMSFAFTKEEKSTTGHADKYEFIDTDIAATSSHEQTKQLMKAADDAMLAATAPKKAVASEIIVGELDKTATFIFCKVLQNLDRSHGFHGFLTINNMAHKLGIPGMRLANIMDGTACISIYELVSFMDKLSEFDLEINAVTRKYLPKNAPRKLINGSVTTDFKSVANGNNGGPITLSAPTPVATGIVDKEAELKAWVDKRIKTLERRVLNRMSRLQKRLKITDGTIIQDGNRPYYYRIMDGVIHHHPTKASDFIMRATGDDAIRDAGPAKVDYPASQMPSPLKAATARPITTLQDYVLTNQPISFMELEKWQIDAIEGILRSKRVKI